MKEIVKIEKYSELKVELVRMWANEESKIRVIHIVIRALRSILTRLKSFLHQLQV